MNDSSVRIFWAGLEPRSRLISKLSRLAQTEKMRGICTLYTGAEGLSFDYGLTSFVRRLKPDVSREGGIARGRRIVWKRPI